MKSTCSTSPSNFEASASGGSFEPELPPPPKKTGRGKGRQSSRPYTAMLVSALNMGLSYGDVKDMRFPELVLMLREWSDMNTPESERVHEASQDDINFLLH